MFKTEIELLVSRYQQIRKMPRYFLRVSLEHLSFRIPELMSIGELFGFKIDIVGEYSDRGVLIIDVEKEEHMEKILDRAILVQ